MDKFPYDLSDINERTAALGLIVLQVDETIEQDFRRLLVGSEIAIYVSRIPSGSNLTPETIAQMGLDLPRAASLLPPAARFDAIGYACTSGTTLIGAEKVTKLVKKQTNTRAVTNPLSAAIAAFTALNVKSVAIVSPYIASVATPIQIAFEDAGFNVPATLSFGEEIEANVARIDPASIHAAAMQIGRSPEVEAVFLSCTNLRTLDIIDDLEQSLGRPVVSSNQALAWHMSQIGSAPLSPDAPGILCQGKIYSTY
ncbi:aspartate/glutamate racemase family protein [Octadecabacter sp. CECT 8868]|uniref:maleate cis-trans isomerase family protein n=1 Tax=Octadecabacter algicola TaxID=2909342 RepID=UPI001F265EBE|nr:aspartate/glutamate racemase family protein [Octadecabacter algicola]MCF2905630.1 aspartate/glutamate racemase family protein [Octadecabacter algicola]